jgi:hypothetical protein
LGFGDTSFCGEQAIIAVVTMVPTNINFDLFRMALNLIVKPLGLLMNVFGGKPAGKPDGKLSLLPSLATHILACNSLI